MTLKKDNHIMRLSPKLWDFFEKRKLRGYGPVQTQINIILTAVKEKGEQDEKRLNK